MVEENKNIKSQFSFGTPQKEDRNQRTFISPISGDTVYYIKSPEDGNPHSDQVLKKVDETSKSVFSNYPWKSPNERLIDMKNATWNTKSTLKTHGNTSAGKLLYSVGPKEAYVVDKTFDRDMNFLELGQLSHDGELIFQKRHDRDYVVNIHSGYNNEHAQSKSNVTHEMRRKLFEEMNDEHDIVLTSPKKYRR